MLKTCWKQLLNHIIFDLYKKRREKRTIIWEMRGFWKLTKMATRERPQPLQNGQFGSKIKLLKTCEKQRLNHLIFVLCKKPTWKTANIREVRGFWKWAKMATRERLWPWQNGQFGLKNKIAKNMRKSTVECFNNSSIQKTDLKNS